MAATSMSSASGSKIAPPSTASGLQQRLQPQRLGRIEPAHARHQRGEVGGGLLHVGFLLGAAGDQRAARRQQRMVGEARRRLAIEAARAPR